MREVYTLFPRKLKDKTVWSYRFWEGDTRRTRSTGIYYTNEKQKAKTKREAVEYCKTLFASRIADGETLREYCEKTKFWDFRRSAYVNQLRMRGKNITENYCKASQSILENRILPEHGDLIINKITPYECEQLLFYWKSSGVKGQTANTFMYCYSSILGEYERTEKMKNPYTNYLNPWRVVKPLGGDSGKFGGLSIEEVKKILDYEPQNDGHFYYLTKLAFMSGLRIGEIIGLRPCDIKDIEQNNIRMSYLEISTQWSDSLNKRVPAKDKETRMIPISAGLRDELQPFLKGEFIFSRLPDNSEPLNPRIIRDWFYKRMNGAGIENRKERRIVFHSTRRFFNTLLRSGNVANSMIQRFTGHDSDKLTEHYTDYLPEDMAAITTAQNQFLSD